MKRVLFVLILICSALTCLNIAKKVTRFELPQGELKWTHTKPEDAKLCIPAAFTGENGFQQLTLIYNSKPMRFRDSSKAIRRALCKDEDAAFILQSNYPMTLDKFAIQCSKHSTNAIYLDMGEYSYGYIKKNRLIRPLYIWGFFTRAKQTNWIYIE